MCVHYRIKCQSAIYIFEQYVNLYKKESRIKGAEPKASNNVNRRHKYTVLCFYCWFISGLLSQLDYPTALVILLLYPKPVNPNLPPARTS